MAVDRGKAVLAAVERGDRAGLRKLIKAGAAVDLADKDGVTPLGHAKARGYAKIAALLEAAGAR